jgi:cytochrome c biogenesis protein ResB
MGLRVSERKGLVVAASRPWTVLASPVFHWAILLLILVILGGRLNRFEGIMGVPVGDSRPLAAGSFGFVDAGGLHSFPSSPNLIRVDRLDLSYPVDGIDRGPAPTVSVVRPDGSVAASHVVYPNNPLRYGSLIIHPGETGLSPGFAIVSREGSEGARTDLLVDFVGVSPSGTSSAQFTLTAPSPADSIVGTVTVPLAKRDGAFVETVPNPAKATFTLGPLAGGAPIAEQTLSAGEELKLPDGSSLRFLGLRHYARLGVVDDPSIPLMYAFLLLALVGLSVSILGAQSLAVVAVRKSGDGVLCIDVFFRDWRANTARVERAEEAIRGALAGQFAVIGDGR